MKSFEEKLPGITEEWVRDGLITSGQRGQILARHPNTHSGSSRFVAIITTLGGLMLAIGLLLMIGSHWEDLGDWAKIGGMLILLIAFFAGGWRFKVEPGQYPKIGEAFLMVGCILFLGGIALVSQIFHINSRPATGAFIWLLGIAPVPWLTRSKGSQFVSIVALLVWLGMEFSTAGGMLELTAGNRYHGDVIVVVWFAMYAALGMVLLLAGLGMNGGGSERFAGMHEIWGQLLACGALYFLGFARHIAHYSDRDFTPNPMPMLVVGAALAFAALWAWKFSRREALGLGPGLLLALAPVAAAFFLPMLGDNGGWDVSILAWTALFALNISMIRTGLHTGREGWVNLGITFIGFNLLSRYFDLFDTMLNRGLFFIFFGVAVIIVGVLLEKQRRKLLAKLQTAEAAP